MGAQVQRLIERQVATASAKAASFSVDGAPCSAAATQHVPAQHASPCSAQGAQRASSEKQLEGPSPKALLEVMFASDSPATVPGPAVPVNGRTAARAITPQVSVPRSPYDVWDLLDALPMTASKCSATCKNESTELVTAAKSTATHAVDDWWDSFDVSTLSVPGVGANATAAIETAPMVISTEGVDELEDFLNSLG